MDTKSWSIHAEFIVIFITLIGGFYTLDGKIKRQSQRTDRLYEMFVDVSNEIKELHGRVSVVETKLLQEK